MGSRNDFEAAEASRRLRALYGLFNLWQCVELLRFGPHFEGISAVLTRKFNQIGNFDRQFCYGFSFGSRLCIDAGINVGNQSIARIDACDPAGPGFDGTLRAKDPKLAAKNVACINTSNIKGTSIYNCHQNYRMGRCGISQPASNPDLSHHQICPYFYIESFDHKFVPNNLFRCLSRKFTNKFSEDVRMGYLGDFNRTKVRGEIFIATAKYSPYLVVAGLLDNRAGTPYAT